MPLFGQTIFFGAWKPTTRISLRTNWTPVLAGDKLAGFLNETEDLWELLYTAARLDETVAQVATTMEPATLAKFAFTLAQRFSLFYHKYRILSEKDSARRLFYLLVVDFVRQSLTRALDLMGIDVPIRM